VRVTDTYERTLRTLRTLSSGAAEWEEREREMYRKLRWKRRNGNWYVLLHGLYSTRGRNETWGRPGQAPLQSDFL